jgi:hypothetical protein
VLQILHQQTSVRDVTVQVKDNAPADAANNAMPGIILEFLPNSK